MNLVLHQSANTDYASHSYTGTIHLIKYTLLLCFFSCVNQCICVLNPCVVSSGP